MKKLNLISRFALGLAIIGAMAFMSSCNKEMDDLLAEKGSVNDTIRLKTDPIGNFDRVHYNNNGLIEGWAADPDAPGASTWVHIYIDGPAGGGGTCIGGVWTNQRRDDVRNAYPWAGYYAGFAYTIPEQYRTGYRVFYLYAINNVAGQNNPFIGSKGATFTTLPAPPPPTLLSPANGASTNTLVLFSWAATPYADRYRIQVSENSNFNTIHFESYLTDLSKSFNLKAGTVYYWRVKAFNATGNTNSATWTLQTSGSGGGTYTGDIYHQNAAIEFSWRYVGQPQRASILLYNNSSNVTPSFKILYRVISKQTGVNIAAGDVDVTLQPYEQKWVTRELAGSGGWPVGSYDVNCWIDINGNVKETNENNNSAYVGTYSIWPK